MLEKNTEKSEEILSIRRPHTSISNHIIPQGFNNYFPLLYGKADSLFEYFSDIDNWIEEESIHNRLSENCKTIKDKFNYIKENDELFLEPKHLYIEETELLEKINNKNPIKIYKDKTLSDTHITLIFRLSQIYQ